MYKTTLTEHHKSKKEEKHLGTNKRSLPHYLYYQKIENMYITVKYKVKMSSSYMYQHKYNTKCNFQWKFAEVLYNIMQCIITFTSCNAIYMYYVLVCVGMYQI